MIGLGAQDARAKIDNVVVQRLAPVLTFEETVDFDDGTTGDLFGAPTSGTWNVVNQRYDSTAGGDAAISLTDLLVSPAALIQLSATLRVTDEGGFVFDHYDSEDFKFVTISAGTITIGHRTNSGSFTDATYAAPTATGTDYTLGLTLVGTTVSVTLDDQPALSHVFNALVTDGNFGLLSVAGTTSFDTFTAGSDAPNMGI